MAALDTHKAFRTLTDAGFPEGQAEALVETIGIGSDELATKPDIADIRKEMATKADIAAVRVEVATLREETATLREQMATKADIADMATQSALKDMHLQMEQRMTNLVIQMVILQVMVGGLIVALIKLLP
jgi:hypothetical protein